MTDALSSINFRDLGGLRARDGRVVRPKLIYRAEGPAGYRPEHETELKALGIRSVCDLRSQGERDAAPHAWRDPNCRLINLEMTTDLRARDQDAWADLRADPSADKLTRAIFASYREMPAALLRHLSTISRALEDDGTPMLINCTAGKDRTGVAIALILSALNISKDVILEDYAKSGPYMANPHMLASVKHALNQGLGVAPSRDMLDTMLKLDPAQLLVAFDEVDRRWGSIEAYFSEGNVGADTLDRLQDALLQ